MGILDGIVEWIAEQVMHGLDLINTSVLGALGCDMAVFLRYFPAAETMYDIFVALAIGLILLTLFIGCCAFQPQIVDLLVRQAPHIPKVLSMRLSQCQQIQKRPHGLIDLLWFDQRG